MRSRPVMACSSRAAIRGSSRRAGDRSRVKTSAKARATTGSFGILRKVSRSSGFILRPVAKSAITRWCGPSRHATLRP